MVTPLVQRLCTRNPLRKWGVTHPSGYRRPYKGVVPRSLPCPVCKSDETHWTTKDVWVRPQSLDPFRPWNTVGTYPPDGVRSPSPTVTEALDPVLGHLD